MFSLIGEKSPTKIAALFSTEEEARTTATLVSSAASLQPGQARLLLPQDARSSRRDLFGQKLEPESKGIARTFWRAHAMLGALGALIGLAAWWMLRDSAFIASTPIASFIAFVGFAATFGMLAGGLVTFRPDQVRVIELVRSGLKSGKWAVVFHPMTSEQTESIQSVLQQRKIEPLSSL